jgi:hypothetical protein
VKYYNVCDLRWTAHLKQLPITVEGVLTDESGTIVARSTAEPAPNVLQPGQSGTFSIPFALQLSEHFKDYRVSVLSQ